ncbi:hypothetical protein Ocin01_16001 [Orchesella cincta]|uniref:Uncharacterized protein n=1 Tax=Orchesella cincta TaxID=48709 RepID=A0A1D2MCH7_ORCCI|nr:hypothetical protein Ocin01_16001 [Orchesella cincta]
MTRALEPSRRHRFHSSLGNGMLTFEGLGRLYWRCSEQRQQSTIQEIGALNALWVVAVSCSVVQRLMTIIIWMLNAVKLLQLRIGIAGVVAGCPQLQ